MPNPHRSTTVSRLGAFITVAVVLSILAVPVYFAAKFLFLGVWFVVRTYPGPTFVVVAVLETARRIYVWRGGTFPWLARKRHPIGSHWLPGDDDERDHGNGVAVLVRRPIRPRSGRAAKAWPRS